MGLSTRICDDVCRVPAITVNRATEICDLMITVSPAIGNAVCSAPMDHNSFPRYGFLLGDHGVERQQSTTLNLLTLEVSNLC